MEKKDKTLTELTGIVVAALKAECADLMRLVETDEEVINTQIRDGRATVQAGIKTDCVHMTDFENIRTALEQANKAMGANAICIWCIRDRLVNAPMPHGVILILEVDIIQF